MLYILRLRKGDCILAVARDEEGARHLARTLGAPAAEVVSVRQLSRFAVRLFPTVAGVLETHSWDDVTLDDILVHEYPLLNEAFHTANKARFMPPADLNKPLSLPNSEKLTRAIQRSFARGFDWNGIDSVRNRN